MISYLSFVTEGRVFQTLNTLEFVGLKLSAITCVHKFSNQMIKIYDLMVRNNYVRVLIGCHSGAIGMFTHFCKANLIRCCP